MSEWMNAYKSAKPIFIELWYVSFWQVFQARTKHFQVTEWIGDNI